MDMEATLGSEYALVLLDIHDALMTWDLDEGRLLQSVCNRLSGSPSISIAFCALINDADVLRVATVAGDGIPDIAGAVLNRTGLQGPLGEVCATGEPLILERGLLGLECEDLKVLPGIFLTQPAVFYPMKSRGRWIGLIGVVGKVRSHQEYSMRLLLQRVAQHTGFALDMLRTFVAQADTAKELRLAASVFDNSLEGIIVTNASGVILKANAAVTLATGYRTEELIGETPRIFRSGRHDQAFYSTFWDSIRHTGQWQGEIWNRRKDGEEFPEWLSISTIFDEHKQARYYIGIFIDLSQQKEAESRLDYLAHHDVLTGLPNRALFNDRLMIAIAHARRSQQFLALLFIDLDQFKYINDCYGHAVGDEVLRETAHRITRCLRDEDTLSRMGGDEFNVLLQNFGSREEVGSVASRILSALEAPVFVNDCVLVISASVGISVYPEDGDDPAMLMNHSDTAMYRAKQDGRGCVRFFQRDMDGYSIARVEMERDMRKALKREEFGLLYQPQFNLESGELVGVEALLRWARPGGGLVAPGQFVALAEETGLIVPIGEWVLRAACAQTKAWQQAGLRPGRVAVNLSAQQFRKPGFMKMVVNVLSDTGLAPDCLELELTESIAMHQVEETAAILRELKSLGVQLSIDDFGTGYSSLSYLKRFPIDRLKIDKSFVGGIADDPSDAAIVIAIVAMAHSLGLRVMAEGVETQDQLNFLKMHHCNEVQGFLLGRPMSADCIEELLAVPS